MSRHFYLALICIALLPAGCKVAKKVTDQKTSSATIVSISPNATWLPENHLRFYIQFSKPMFLQDPEIFEYFQLLDQEGRQVYDAFYRDPLWSRDRKTLTLYLNLGRQKLGLKPNEQLGRVLKEGEKMTLLITSGICDQFGLPLTDSYKKSYFIRNELKRKIDVASWKLSSVTADSHDSLIIDTYRIMDIASISKFIQIYDSDGESVPHKARQFDTKFELVPITCWKLLDYKIKIDDRLEDSCGNNLIKPFEIKAGSKVVPAKIQSIHFTPISNK